MAVNRFLKVAQKIQAEALEEKVARPAPTKEHDDTNWLVSYADMMTLLCVFFIMLFSVSTLNKPAFDKVKQAVAKDFHGQYQSPTQDLAKFVTNVIQEAGIEKQATVKSDVLGVSVAFQSAIFFDTLSAEVS